MAWAVLNGKIWILGGLRDGVALQTVESYDPRTGAWQTQPPLPIPLHHATAATYRGEVVVLGGSSGDLTQSSTKVFALRGGNWVELPGLTHARAAAAAAVVGDNSSSPAGRTPSNSSRRPRSSTAARGTMRPICPPRANTWPRCRMAPTSTRSAAGSCPPTRTPRHLSGSTRDPGHGPSWWPCRPRAEATAPTFIDGRILAIGGEQPTRVLGVAEMYDIAGGNGPHCPLFRPRATLRRSQRSATPCTASVAQIGLPMRALLRRSRRWTSLAAVTIVNGA